MTEREKEKKNKKKEEDIKIDYDHIDVADIMDQIKRKVAMESKEPSKREISKEESYPAHVPFEPGVEEPAPGPKGKIKKILLKIMKPVSPLIKLLVLPVHEQTMQTDRKLHQTNRRLDYLNAKSDQEIGKLNTAIARLDQINQEVNKELSTLNVRLDQVNKEVNKRVDQVSKTQSKRLDLAFSDLSKIMDYTKLLHNLSHNIVAELSKLKIEEEYLESKTRIMEKDFEFLGKREKTLESKVFG